MLALSSSTVRRALARSLHAARPALLPVKPFLLADIGEGITECEITQWFVKEGDAVAQFDKLCEVQSDKAAVEISSRFDGRIVRLHHRVGDLAKVGAPLVDIDVEDAAADPEPARPQAATAPGVPGPKAPSAPSTAPAAPATTAAAAKDDHAVLTTPAVRRVARENNVDLAKVMPTGKGGRITKEDVLAFIARGGIPQPPAAAAAAAAPTAPLSHPPPPAGPEVKVKPLTQVQRAMYKAMTRSLTIPHFGYTDELPMDAAAKLRAALNAEPGASKMSFLPVLLKAFSVALRQFPLLNAQVVADPQTGKPALAYRAHHNIGVAMDTPAGLLVPNVKRVDAKSVREIAADLHDLQERAKRGALSPADMSGGTVTLSNIGALGGGTSLHPVLVESEVCIAAVGAARHVPVWKDGQWVPHLLMPVSFSADHRVVDGATVARFAAMWKRLLADPALMVAHLK